jgi:hypothetical protein
MPKCGTSVAPDELNNLRVGHDGNLLGADRPRGDPEVANERLLDVSDLWGCLLSRPAGTDMAVGGPHLVRESDRRDVQPDGSE